MTEAGHLEQQKPFNTTETMVYTQEAEAHADELRHVLHLLHDDWSLVRFFTHSRLSREKLSLTVRLLTLPATSSQPTSPRRLLQQNAVTVVMNSHYTSAPDSNLSQGDAAICNLNSSPSLNPFPSTTFPFRYWHTLSRWILYWQRSRSRQLGSHHLFYIPD